MILDCSKLTQSQLISEGNQFEMPDYPLNQDRILKNLFELTYPYLADLFPSDALCSFDIYTLLSYINQYRVRSVTEFGFGVSTAIMAVVNVIKKIIWQPS